MKLWPLLMILIFSLSCNSTDPNIGSVDPNIARERKILIEGVNESYTPSLRTALYSEDIDQLKNGVLGIFKSSCDKDKKCWIKKVSFLDLDKKPIYEYDNKNFDPTKKNITSISSKLNTEGEDHAIFKIEYALD